MSIEHCINCDEPTGRAGEGEDSIFAGGVGPLCEDCYAGIKQAMPSHSADASKMVELRPMSEAPKDGTRLLLFLNVDDPDIAFWDHCGWLMPSLGYYQDKDFIGWLPIPQVEVKP